MGESLDAMLVRVGSMMHAAKHACRVVSTSNITLAGTQTIDGVAVAAGERVLVAGQTNAADNGIYVCSSGVWARAQDMNVSKSVVFGLSVRITSGTAYAGSTWALSSPVSGAVSLGSTALAFDKISDALNPALDALPSVIMFNGQSNMVAGPTPTFGYSELTALLGPDLLGWGHTAAAWTQVVDGSCNARANHGGIGTGAGPGLGQIGTRLARDIADATGQTIRTYSLAYSGQPISYFLPASATRAYFEDGTQHGSLNNYNLLKSYVTAGGYTPQWYVWCQGEADAGRTPDAYYADLSTLWTQLQIDYPGIKLLIIGTIGDAQDRSGPATGTVTGVRMAQKRLAAENPTRVFFVDNTDLRYHTAYWYLNHYYAYSGTYAGYQEVARRCFSKLRGEADRPRLPVSPVIDHPQSVFSFDHVWAQRHSLGVGGVLASWQDDIGSDSLGVENGTPEHVASDPNFGGRTVIRFDQTASERMTESSIAGSNIWTWVALVRVTTAALAGTPTVWQLETAPGTNRIAFLWSGQQHFLDLNGSGSTFTGPAICEGNVPHVYGVTYNGSAGTAKLYIDGVLVSSLSGLANVNSGGAAMRVRIGSYSGVGHFGGEMAFLACKAGVEATADQMAAIQRGLRAEFGLEV